MQRAPILFDGCSFGMMKADVSQKAQASPCEDNSFALCAKTVFVDLEWQETFIFNNQDELKEIILSCDQPRKYRDVMAGLEQAGWLPVFLEEPDSAYDFFAARDQDFSKTAPSESPKEPFTIHFLHGAVRDKLLGKAAVKSYDAAIEKAGESVVVCSMMCGDGWLKLSFTAPLLSRKDALRYGQMIRR